MKRTDRLPYPGLRAYERDETDLFFGRDGCVNEMVDKLAATRFLAVLGASGAGKSSLVRTGLFDALELGFMQDAGSNWTIVDFHPAGRPMRQLASALLEARDGKKPADEDIGTLEAFLRRGPESVLEWIADGNLRDGCNLLLLADQFEELFRYGDYAGRETAEAFAALLLESARLSDRVFVVLTMRSEYLGACALIPGLAEQINASLYLARRMTREEVRQAIAGPARVCGFDIEPQLVTRLLNDLASFAPWEEDRERSQLHRLARQADQLPLMQHALSRLWQKARQREGAGRTVLTFADYEAIGFLEGALDQHGDEVIAGLSPAAQPLVQSVFRALVAGSSLADAVRRPLPFARLVEIVGADRALVEEIVNAFRASGCNFLRPSLHVALADDTMIDISHESLIRQWRRLAAWFGEESRSAATWARLVGATERYRAGEGGLLVGLDFANARAWFDQTEPTSGWADLQAGKPGPATGTSLGEVEAFLGESQANAERDEREREERLEQERRQQRELLAMREQERDSLRKRYAMIVALAVVCLVAAGYFLYANGQLTEATIRAEELAAAEAEARAIADKNAADAALAAERAAEAAIQAESAAAEAKRQEEEANTQRQRAADALALAEERLAQAQVNLAKFLSYASLAEPNSVLAMGLILAALPLEVAASPEPGVPPEATPCRTGLNCPVPAVTQTVVPAAVEAFTTLAARDRLIAALRFGNRSVSFSSDGARVVSTSGSRARIWEGATGRQIINLLLESTISAASLAPDGSRLVTASEDGTVRIWDAVTGDELLKLTLGGNATDASFSSDGGRVLTASHDGSARVWDAKTGMPIARMNHDTSVLAAAFSPDGLSVVSSSDDGTVELWNAASGESIARLSNAASVSAVSFSADGRRVLTMSWDDVSVWDAQTGRRIAPLKHDSTQIYAAFSPDGNRVVVGLGDGTARVWDVSGSTVSQIARLRHDSSVRWAAFSPDGTRLATASDDNSARIWDTATWRETIKVMHDGTVNEVAFSADGSRIATASEDSSVRVWDARPSREVMRFDHAADVSAAAFSADGNRLLTTTTEYTAQVFDVATGKQIVQVRGNSDEGLNDAALSPDGRTLVTTSFGPVRIWDAESGAPIAQIDQTQPAYSVAFSPDGQFFLTIGQDDTIIAWNTATRSEVARVTHDDTAYDGSFSPDSTKMLTASYDGSARVVDLATGAVVRLPHGLPVYSAVFSPDGKRVLTGSDDSAARIWDAETGELLLLVMEEGSIYETAFSPDGNWIATASSDGQVKIRRATTGAIATTLKHAGSPYTVSFSADGDRVLTMSDDGLAQVWDIAIGKPSWTSAGSDSVDLASFAPDGRSIVVVTDTVARIWRSLTTADSLALARASEMRPLTIEEQTEYSVQPTAAELVLAENRKRFTECDREAGHPFDPFLGPGGKEFDSMDSFTAIAVCQRAVEDFPDEPRFRYQLGRALRKADNKTAAVRNYDVAARMGYPMAFYNLGIAYANGEGAPVIPERAFALYREALERGVPIAAHSLGWIYWNGITVAHNAELARTYWTLGADAGYGVSHWSLAELADGTRDPAEPVDLAKALYHYSVATRLGEQFEDVDRTITTRYHRATLARNLPPRVVVEQWHRANAFTPKPIDRTKLPE